jgi:hypothetical protein
MFSDDKLSLIKMLREDGVPKKIIEGIITWYFYGEKE